MSMLLAELQRALKKRLLNRLEHTGNSLGETRLRHGSLLAVIPASQNDLILLQVLRPDFDSKWHAALFPVVELPSRTVLFPCVDFEADSSRCEWRRKVIDGLHDAIAFFGLPENRHDGNLSCRQPRRDNDAVVITVCHDEGADHARRQTPARGVNVFASSRFRLKRGVKGFGKILG